MYIYIQNRKGGTNWLSLCTGNPQLLECFSAENLTLCQLMTQDQSPKTRELYRWFPIATVVCTRPLWTSARYSLGNLESMGQAVQCRPVVV